MIDLAVDEPSRLIMTVGVGRWTAAEVEAYFAKLKNVVSSFRERGLPIRFLRDVVGADVQTAEIEALIHFHSQGLYLENDRTAMVVRDALLVAHARGGAALKNTALFSSHAAAEEWLFADDPT